mmetsp:Transcript_7198/g.18787  ORF Transcript_7198/g.18787 Transcript_7198/m.18787 type:complete len:208 (+) Transcript_7198:753-1376(+)
MRRTGWMSGSMKRRRLLCVVRKAVQATELERGDNRVCWQEMAHAIAMEPATVRLNTRPNERMKQHVSMTSATTMSPRSLRLSLPRNLFHSVGISSLKASSRQPAIALSASASTRDVMSPNSYSSNESLPARLATAFLLMSPNSYWSKSPFPAIFAMAPLLMSPNLYVSSPVMLRMRLSNAVAFPSALAEAWRSSALCKCGLAITRVV